MEFDGANTLTARYSHGDRVDQPLSVERGGQSYFYQADHQGSVVQITDAAGFVVNSYEYDSYGNIESAVEGIPNPFTYTGREFDAESGLYYYRARYYDAQTGRFTTEDPIGIAGGGINYYQYVMGNPGNLADPLGLWPTCETLPAGIDTKERTDHKTTILKRWYKYHLQTWFGKKSKRGKKWLPILIITQRITKYREVSTKTTETWNLWHVFCREDIIGECGQPEVFTTNFPGEPTLWSVDEKIVHTREWTECERVTFDGRFRKGCVGF